MDVEFTCNGAPTPGSPSPGDLPTPSATAGAADPAPRRVPNYLGRSRYQGYILRAIADRAQPGRDAKRILALANGSREVPPELWDRVESVFRHNTVGGILLGDLINFARATHPITSSTSRPGPRFSRRTPPAARGRKPALAPAKPSPAPELEDHDPPNLVLSPTCSPRTSTSISPLPASPTYSLQSASCSDSDAPRTASPRPRPPSPLPDDPQHAGHCSPEITRGHTLESVSPLPRPIAQPVAARQPVLPRARTLQWNTTAVSGSHLAGSPVPAADQ
jgi:hypothetical protein